MGLHQSIPDTIVETAGDVGPHEIDGTIRLDHSNVCGNIGDMKSALTFVYVNVCKHESRAAGVLLSS